MFKINLLRAEMARLGYNQEKLASAMGITSKTLSEKLKNHPEKFTHKELTSIVEILDIKNPGEIFFGR